MKRLPIPLRFTFTLLAIATLAACAPGDLPSAEEIESAINTAVAMTIEAEGKIATSVAMTVAARETEAAGAVPTATLSPTPLPSLTPVLATATPFTIAPSSGGGGGGGTTKYAYACDPDIRKRPFDNTEFNPNGTFDIIFTILNTGTATWEAGKDLTLLGGSFITAPAWATIELPEMKPGDTFTVGPYDAMAPAESGHYVMDFKLEGGWCYPYIAINVK